MNEARPDPEQPLAGVNAEEARARRGKLRIFFGGSAGAGLGLAICRAIARAHGGDIAAQVRPGGGARLVFTLPVREPPA